MPYTTIINNHLIALKQDLQILESAVQEPQDNTLGNLKLLSLFPQVIKHFIATYTKVLYQHDMPVCLPAEIFPVAHRNNWLCGDLEQWEILHSHFEKLQSSLAVSETDLYTITKDIRACSAMLWQTFELLSMKFRNGKTMNTESVPHQPRFFTNVSPC